MINQGQVPVRTVAAKLRGEFVFVNDSSGLEGMFPYGGFVADVFEGDLLVIVYKENRALGGMMISLIWFSPRLPYMPDFSLSRWASSASRTLKVLCLLST